MRTTRRASDDPPAPCTDRAISRAPRRGVARLFCGALVSAALAAGLGCEGGAIPGIEPGSQSLLGFVVDIETPQQAAEMALDPYDADNRFRGVSLISNAPFGGEEVYIELYEDALTDEDAGVRWAGVRGLAMHGDPTHAESILRMLIEDEDVLVRAEAARALQRLHNPEAIDALLIAIDEDREDEVIVRAEAAHALGQYAEPRVVRSLIAALNDRALSVNHATLESLATLTGQGFGYEARAWLDWMDSTESLFAAQTPYTYPAFTRDRRWMEYIPFVGNPPNETASTPVGAPPPSEG